MKVLVVLSTSPYPKDVGKRIMLGGICDYLKQSPQVSSICVASFVGKGQTAGMDYTVALPRPSSKRKIFNAIWHSAVSRRKSLQESFFWNPRAEQKLEVLTEFFQPDLILYDTLRTGQYLRERANRNPCVEIIYMDDLFSVRYGKMLDAMEEHSLDGLNAMGNFGDNVPAGLLAFYEKSPGLQKLLLQIERSLIASSEDRAPSSFDRALLVSSSEQAVLASRTQSDNVFAIPPRVDSLSPQRRAWHGRPEFVFLGSLNLAHNTISIETFLEQSMDAILALIPDVRISIIGKGAGGNLRKLAARYPEHVVLHGFVDNFDDVLLRACAMISPLTFGSGVKLKVIDSLRCGTPLITTSFGIEGIETGGSSGVRQVDQIKEFPAAMYSLLNPEVNERASRDNAALYREFYSQAAVDEVYGRLFLNEEAAMSVDGLYESTPTAA